MVGIKDWRVATLIKKLKIHYQQWKRWEKRSLNSRFHKIMVLLGLRISPTFEMMKTEEKIAKNTIKMFEQFSKATILSVESFAKFGEVVHTLLGKEENDEK